MAKNSGSKCKFCRRVNLKLFLKGDRCQSDKCAMVRKPYPPGNQGSNLRRGLSDFGKQLNEKQKLKRIYGISESQLSRYVKNSQKKQGVATDNLTNFLEMRLDNVVFRMGLARSRKQARQLVSHSLFLVNDKVLNIPSAQLKVGDEIKVKVKKAEKNFFKELKVILRKSHKTPQWISFDPEQMAGKILSNPTREESSFGVNIATVLEFYSRA